MYVYICNVGMVNETKESVHKFYKLSTWPWGSF